VLGARQICASAQGCFSAVDQNLILPLERNRAAPPRNHDRSDSPAFPFSSVCMDRTLQSMGGSCAEAQLSSRRCPWNFSLQKTLGPGMKTLTARPQHTTCCYARTPRLTLILLDLVHDLVHYVTSESGPSNLSTVAFNWSIELKSWNSLHPSRQA